MPACLLPGGLGIVLSLGLVFLFDKTKGQVVCWVSLLCHSATGTCPALWGRLLPSLSSCVLFWSAFTNARHGGCPD